MRRYLQIFTILIALISCSESAEHKNNIGNAECVDETNCEKTSSLYVELGKPRVPNCWVG